MKVKVTQEFSGVEDGKHHPRTIEVGEEITGDLADVALRNKWATEIKPTAKSAKK